MLNQLQDRLTKVFRNIQGKGKLSERNMEDTLNEIRLALLDSDVNYYVTKKLLETIRLESIGKDVLNSIEPGQLLVKIVHDELIKILGNDNNDLLLNENGLSIIMLVGLQGTGKTTHAAKIANYLKKKDKRVLLIAADIIRPAAIEQLKVLGDSIGIETYSEGTSVSVIEQIENGIEYAKKNGFDVCIIDTAGRLQIDEALMNELLEIKQLVNPNEILLTVDALTGQDICNVATAFNEKLDISGLIVTKFDGDSKGGAVLSAKAVSNVPIKFTGVGEKINDLEEFHPNRVVERILGMGDIVSLVEKAQEEFDLKKAEETANRLMSGKFTMNDLLNSIEQSSKLGPISSLMSMIPGVSEYASKVNDDDANSELKKIRAIIYSMTPSEREDPLSMRSSHKRRIASGSGTSINDVNKLVNQYEKMSKMFKSFSSMKSKFGL